MTPMIDVVFLLLIFFMTVSQISELVNEPVSLPKQPGSEDQEPALITINVLANGEIRMAGEAATLSDVYATVFEELQLQGNDSSRMTVVVRGDDQGESRTVNKIIRQLDKLNIRHVRLAVEVPQG